MSGFHRQRLRGLRKAAGLGAPVRRSSRIRYLNPPEDAPMPSFRVPGMRLLGDKESDYIEGPYFSPEARHWMREASRFRAQGGTLSVDDEECSDRVLTAMMEGRKPTPGQEARFTDKQLLKRGDFLMVILRQREMKRRGYNYGPDNELPDSVELPSWRRMCALMAVEVGTTPGAVRSAFHRWRDVLSPDGTH